MFKTDIAYENWEKSYRYGDETPLGTQIRTATTLASVENKDQQEYWKKVFLNTLVKFKNGEPVGLKCTPGGRITANIGTSYKHATLLNCFSGNVEYLDVEKGFVTFSEMCGKSTVVLTKKGPVKADIRCFGVQSTYDYIFKPAYSSIRFFDANGNIVKSGTLGSVEKEMYIPPSRISFTNTITATKNHRWILDGGSETTDLKIGDIVESNVIDNKTLNTEEYRKGIIHGLIFGDGSHSYTYTDAPNSSGRFGLIRFSVRLCGAKSEYKKYFEEEDILYHPSGDGDPTCYYTCSQDLKDIPTYGINSIDYIKGFIDGLIATDGHLYYKDKNIYEISTSDEKAAEWVRKYAIIAGYLVTGYRIDTNMETNYGKRKHPNIRVILSKEKIKWKVTGIVENDNQEVFCAVVPEEHSFTLAHGIYTGNCYIAAPVSNAKIHYSRHSKEAGIGYEVDLKSAETPDDLINIFLTVMEQAKTLASEGGYGINFEFIRPRGAIIKGTGIRHPGVIAYMKIWDSVSECIVKGTDDGYTDKIKNLLGDEKFKEAKEVMKKKIRKGAMMSVLPTSHPDIEEYVRVKQSSGILTKFNMSVLMDDAFLKAVENDDTYEQSFNGVVYKKIRALELYNLIMESCYNRGEPGVLFVDNMQKNNPVSYLGQVRCCNPCVAPETMVLTERGHIRIGDYENKNVNVWNGYEFSDVLIKKTGENTELWDVEFSNGEILSCTEAHVFHIQEGFKGRGPTHSVVTCDLKVGDKLIKYELPIIHQGDKVFEYAYTHGFFCADGCYKHTENGLLKPKVYLYAEKKELVGALSIKSGTNVPDARERLNYYLPEDLALKFEIPLDGYRLIDRIEWFAGYADGDGCICTDKTGNQSLQITSVNKSFLLGIRLMLQTLGIDSKVVPGKPEQIKEMPDGLGGLKEYQCKECHRLLISSNGLYRLHQLGWKPLRLKYTPKKPNREAAQFIKVTKITKTERRSDVFCFTESKRHLGMFNGILTGQCGEVPGLTNLTSVCLLGSLNLTQYVEFSSDNRPYFDWKTYEEDIGVFARMLDNVIDISYNPLPGYDWAMKNLRQFGMGINGLGSTLLMLGIPYNSREAIDFTKKACSRKEDITWQASALLAKEKGVFGAYIKDRFETTEYFRSDRITEATKDLLREYGARNAKTTTSPPLGNSSVVCDNVSNGIEPVYDLEYERTMMCKDWPEGLTADNVRDMLKYHKEKDFEYWRGEYKGKVYYFEPQNRGLCEVDVIRDYGYQWLLDNYPGQDHSKYLITTKNISIDDHLNIQAVVQYYNNQSVSKTVNLPKDYPFEDFKRLYIDGWRRGLNGLTTYRTGSMESVLGDLRKSRGKEIISKDIKLPSVFNNGPTRIIKKEGKKFYIHFSYLPDDKEMQFPVVMWIYTNAHYKEDLLICNKASRNLGKLALSVGIDERIVREGMSKAKEDYPHNRLGRMISLCLRHNVPRADILAAIMHIDGDSISTLLSAVRKFLAETLENGTRIKGMRCENEECRGTRDHIIYDGGCFRCKDCGSTKCGA